MFNLALVMGISLLVIVMIINIIITVATPPGGYGIYIPAAAIAVVGGILVTISAAADIEMMGLGLGGWGGASLFAAALALIVTSIVESYRHP
ncbi:hypothetical protein SAMN05216238_11094 [Lentibacillus persicus]|uniref:Uncharacterized protein n=1 Tax=Lentibacillus persicus TaxID=640948 RepID=A0A1I1YT55_9BACI|nr:hypothetical protein [Lentibacillus persicus]SFE22649.1 hypothetical protein SAMN05216238_11094 [Lentibacillus persicus]